MENQINYPKLTPSLVLKAYKETGLRPVARVYNTPRCGCPLTAVYCLEHKIKARTKAYNQMTEDVSGIDIFNWAKTKFGANQVESFVAGFDDSSDGYTQPYHCNHSYSLGMKVFKSVKNFFGRIKKG